jgi:hypothetical protein
MNALNCVPYDRDWWERCQWTSVVVTWSFGYVTFKLASESECGMLFKLQSNMHKLELSVNTAYIHSGFWSVSLAYV